MLCPIVVAADVTYALPLTVTLRSLAENNQKHWPLDIAVFDGFPEEMREKVLSSLPEGAARVRWLPTDLRLFETFSAGHDARLSKLTYARLTIPSLFPDAVSRLLYLDVDILVFEDLLPLCAADLGGAPAGAVHDFYLHTLSLNKGLDPVKERASHPLHGGELPPVREYFNTGVLLIDLDRWRKEKISEKAIEYLHTHPTSPFMDQDGINFALAGRWAGLDSRWNVQYHYRKVVPGKPGNPAILHFMAKAKPWIAESRSHNAALYDSFRNRTKFARTRREKLRDSFIRLKTGIRNVLKRGLRKPLLKPD